MDAMVPMQTLTIDMDLNFIFYFFFFIFGAIIGSFLNVVSLRINTGKSMIISRSACFSCGKELSWFELIPIFSFLFQKGKCRKCLSKISPQYILVEAIMGFIFIAVAHMYIGLGSWSTMIILQIIFILAIFSILMVITIYDLRHMIIPDLLSYLFSFLSLIYGALFHVGGLSWFIAGPALALPFALIWLVSKGKWMGLGDAKLALGIGWFLGLTGGFTAIMYAFWIGALISVLMMLINRGTKHGLSMKSEVPFAPFLIIGLTVVFFTQFDLVKLLLIGF